MKSVFNETWWKLFPGVPLPISAGSRRKFKQEQEQTPRNLPTIAEIGGVFVHEFLIPPPEFPQCTSPWHTAQPLQSLVLCDSGSGIMPCCKATTASTRTPMWVELSELRPRASPGQRDLHWTTHTAVATAPATQPLLATLV